MVRGLSRLRAGAALCLIIAAGCMGGGRPPEELRQTASWVDPNYGIGHDEAGWDFNKLAALAEKIREQRKPKGKLPPKRNILAISGGGSYGAFSAGVLCGWSETGTRPEFDVVTGISTGALIAPLAFLGPAYDCQLKQFYTTVTNDDIYKKHKAIKALFSESFADNAPLRGQIEKTVTPEVMAAVAAAHMQGRRLYIGTTDLEGRRQVIWDIGAIATRNEPGARKLVIDVLLASAAIPGFFPPVPITVTAGGRSTTERHVDGGVSCSLFLVPPHVPPEEKPQLPQNWLYDSNLYLLMAGKLYSDPEPVPKQSLKVASSGITTVLYAQARGDLQRLFTLTMMSGMKYHLASIPQDFDAPTSCTEFNPVSMTRMFDEGVRQIREGVAWRDTPPGMNRGETAVFRGGTQLIGGGTGPVIIGQPFPGGVPFITPEGIPVPPPPFKK
jgi:hypothetical protein